MKVKPVAASKKSRALETEIDFEGKKPFYRAVQLATDAVGPSKVGALFARLPLPTRAAALLDIFHHGFAYDLDESLYGDVDLLAGIRGAELATWAKGEADRMIALAEERRKTGRFRFPVETYCWPIFVALVRAGVAIEPRWDALLPVGTKGRGLRGATMKECLAAIPEERRMKALVASLAACPADGGAWPAFETLSLYPAKEIIAWLHESKIVPNNVGLTKDLKALAKKNKRIADALAAGARGGPVAALLTSISIEKPRQLAALSNIQQKQLRAAGKAYDGKDLGAALRMATGQSETSLRSTLEIRALADASKKHVYDAFLYEGDSGVIFQAGTTKVVAQVVQGSVAHKDEGLALGLRDAITTKSRAATSKKSSTAKTARLRK